METLQDLQQQPKRGQRRRLFKMAEIQRPDADRIYQEVMAKNQLAKGKQGEEREDAIYYWSPSRGETRDTRDPLPAGYRGQGSVYYEPAPDRYPIYRTDIPRQVKQGNASDF